MDAGSDVPVTWTRWETTTQWVPLCPICGGEGVRDTHMLALDCTCRACGWHYTSTRSRALLRALTRPES